VNTVEPIMTAPTRHDTAMRQPAISYHYTRQSSRRTARRTAKPLRILVLLGIAFIGGTVLSDTVGRVFWTHASPTGLFSAFAQDSERDRIYRPLGLFGDAFERVRSEYVDPVPDKVLIDGAIDGMLAGLDPHSGYMDAREFREMQLESAGKFGAIGIEVALANGVIKGGDAHRQFASVESRYPNRRCHHSSG
jgi:hypothetical protein